MSNVINFGEVKSTEYVSKKVKPGVGVFTIEEAEFKDNSNGKRYMMAKFVNEAGQDFKHMFYVTTMNGWGRVKELAENAGEIFGQETEDTIVAKLVGKKVGLLVNGVKENAIIEGKPVVVTRAELRFTNFSFKVGESKFTEADVKIEDKTAGGAAKSATAAPVPPMGGAGVADDELPF